MQWNLRRSADDLPTLNQMFTFMQLRASMLDTSPAVATCDGRSDLRRNMPPVGTGFAAQRGVSTGRGDEPRPVCDLCPGQVHWPFKCFKFKTKSISDRLNYVLTRHMCTNCFSLKHLVKACPDKGCPKCKSKHNSCLCPANVNIGGQPGSIERMRHAAGLKKG